MHSREDIRALLTSLHTAAVQGADPFVRTRDAVAKWIDAQSSPGARVHVFALGKAGAAMAAGAVDAIESAGLHVAGGVAVVAARIAADATREQGGNLPPAIAVRVGDHPVPDIGSLSASDTIGRAVTEVNDGDIAIVLMSGGATSLCAAPCRELSEAYGHPAIAQQALAGLASTLHERGLTIDQMNAIRRRLMRWTAGRLAVALFEQYASAIPVFAISDVIGDDPAVIGSGPCSPDYNDTTSTVTMLDALGLRSELDLKISIALGLQGDGSEAVSTPDPFSPAFELTSYEIVARNSDSCQAMAEAALDRGIPAVYVFPEPLQGEAAPLGEALIEAALRAAEGSNAEQLLIWGGEPTVDMTSMYDEDEDGGLDGDDILVLDADDASSLGYQKPSGGRMQTLALSAAIALHGASRSGTTHADRITVLAAGTDGRDGPTDACGAIVDASTTYRMRGHHINPRAALLRMSSHPALEAAGALLRTGPTGTNVMDVVAAYIARDHSLDDSPSTIITVTLESSRPPQS